MESKTLQTLNIDKDFKNLIRPLQKTEYLQLEANLLADGCRDPIITWNGIIIDGHNRYELCMRHQIPYAVVEMEFDCRESVIAWICANQLGRRNITEETRKFLIGMQYESEKLAHSLKNARGKNQYCEPEGELSCTISDSNEETGPSPSGHVTAQRIAQENQISGGTVLKYAIYTRALEAIGQKAPEIVPKILSGRYKISHKNVVDLSRLTSDEIKKVGRRIERSQQPFVQYNSTRQEIQNTVGQASSSESPSIPSVKDMQQITSKTNRSTLKGVQPALCAAGNPHVVHPEIAGTLCASAAGLSRPAGMASETDLTVAYCLQGSMIGREDKNGPAGSGINKDICFTLNAADRPAVVFNRQRSDLFKEQDIASTQSARQHKDATDLVCDICAVDCRNFNELDDVSGTLQAKTTSGYSLNFQNPVRDGYIVRRLTPTECERLMGFPDGWTEYGHDGKLISDSRRYSMLGNSIATPCAAYIIQGILEQYEKEEE